MTLRSAITAWRRRALPISLGSLQAVKCASYSQFGEDAILRGILGDRYPAGLYIDVGCFHPVKWSNTYALYLQQWRGICIDPNQDFAALWRGIRPRDEYVSIGISDAELTLGYVTNVMAPQENHLRIDTPSSRDVEETTPVAVRRLDAVLRERLRPGTTLDVMSIDCEGHDLRVLRSNDFSAFRPRVLIVEDKAPLAQSDISAFCETQGYRLAGMCGPSRVFVDRAWKRRSKHRTDNQK